MVVALGVQRWGRDCRPQQTTAPHSLATQPHQFKTPTNKQHTNNNTNNTQQSRPWVVCSLQYGNGDFAPGVANGDWGKWTCGHHLLLAHATAVKAYRDRYQAKQGGKIGMALWSEWSEPWTDAAGGARIWGGRGGQ